MSYIYKDEYGMLLREDVFNQGNVGERDSIGRTFEGVILYDLPIDALLSCYKGGTLYRHPAYTVDDCSRDHMSYFYMALQYKGATDTIKELRGSMKWRISNFANFTLDLWSYVKGSIPIYYMVQIPSWVFTVLWHKLVLKLGGFEKEPRTFKGGTPSKRHLFWRKLLYPVYSLYNTSWQVYFLKPSLCKRVMQKLMLSICPEHNYVIKLLNGGKVSPCEVGSYIPMTGDRWTSHLSYQRCDRIHVPLTAEQASKYCIDLDLLWKLYYNV